jgi:hypothetical protein
VGSPRPFYDCFLWNEPEKISPLKKRSEGASGYRCQFVEYSTFSAKINVLRRERRLSLRNFTAKFVRKIKRGLAEKL